MPALIDRVCVVAQHQSCAAVSPIHLPDGSCGYCPAGAATGHRWLRVPCVPIARVRALACALDGSTARARPDRRASGG